MPLPAYTFDAKRLAALEDHHILDTPAEPGFDNLVALAMQICDTPVALVSLVSGDRQWFKARIGVEANETDLNSAICAHVLVEPDLLIIPDLTLDARTASNVLVAGEPFLRFYAGAPLKLSTGEVLGSLSVIDRQPRPQGLSDGQASGLRHLARQVVTQIELRKAVADRDAAIKLKQDQDLRRLESEEQYRLLFNAIDDGFCIIEMKFEGEKPVDYRFVELNPAFARQTGLEDVQGKWIRDLAPNHEQYWFDIYGKVASTGEPVRVENHAEEIGGRWFEVNAFRVGDPSLRHVAVLFSDKTDRKLADDAKKKAYDAQEIINHEISHRMKNTLAMVQAIAMQTLRNVADQDAVASFTQRLHALSMAHDVLLKQNWSAAKLNEVVKAVVSNVTGIETFDVDGPLVHLGPRATLSVSLLLHELATNAMKYGALSVGHGRVALDWNLEGPDNDKELIFSWTETGGPPAQAPSRKGFGSKLIKMGLVGTGGVELRYEPSGFKAQFKAPLAQVQQS